METVEKFSSNNLDISIIIPFYNEEKSLPVLCDKITDVLGRIKKSFEVILIDDGSEDNSYEQAKALKKDNANIKLIKLRSNSGKARALDEGFQIACGEIVITMDADLQDDPEEIPNFLDKIKQGFDLVTGWKKRRLDPLEKRIPSKFFNYITSLATGIRLHDFNCGFKAYKREVIDEIKVYGYLHRYIPALAHWKGFRVGELPVKHHPRAFGRSKYGWSRYLEGFFDLFTVILLTRFSHNPIYLFGSIGIFILLVGLAIVVFITMLQVVHGSILGRKPLSFLGILNILFGSQLVATGLIAQMLNAIKKGMRPYSVRQIIPGNHEEKKCDISIIIPIYNAVGYLDSLIKDLEDYARTMTIGVEVLFVDDGSNDGSLDKVRQKISVSVCDMSVVSLRRHFGRSAVVKAGIDYAAGDKIAVIDVDMKDIKDNLIKIFSPLEDNFDVAIGWRKDMPFVKAFFSKVLNIIASLLLGGKLHDVNCGFQAMKKEVFQHIPAYHQQFLNPFIAVKHGFKVAEVEIDYNAGRFAGIWDRLKHVFRIFLDILSGVLMTNFSARPMHLFGLVGLFIGAAGFIINLYIVILKFLTGDTGGHYTLLLMGVTLMVLGLQWFSTGLLGEIINNLQQRDNKRD